MEFESRLYDASESRVDKMENEMHVIEILIWTEKKMDFASLIVFLRLRKP